MIKELKENNYGFIQDTDVPAIVAENRFEQILIRCGCGRLVCSAQDVTHFVGIIDKSKEDYVRDVSFLSGGE